MSAPPSQRPRAEAAITGLDRADGPRTAGIARTFEILLSLTQSDLRVRYGRGGLWQVARWLFEPFALVGVYLLLVTIIVSRPGVAPGLSIACAIVPFQLLMLSVTNAMSVVTSRRPVITNMAFKRNLLPLSSTLTESVAFVASFVLIATMMLIYGVRPSVHLLWLPPVVAVTVVFSVAFAYPASLYGLWFRELKAFGLSFIRILFFVGPGLVPLEATGGAARWLKLNPLTGLFESYRDIFLYGRAPEAWQLLYPLGFALVLLAAFWPLYRREQREFAKVAS